MCSALLRDRRASSVWPYSPHRLQLMCLLRAAFQGRRDSRLATFDDAQIRWAIETGLGPLLVHTTTADPQAAASPLWPYLQGADLLARMLTGERFDAMSEILDMCEGRVPALALLKGISIADQHYPSPHLRPMRDIDILVDELALPTIESLLYTLGYRQQSHNPPEFYDAHHHCMPFVHPQRGIWVEVHRGLFPSHSRMGTDRIFGREHLNGQLQPSTFQGRPVMRLSDALQIVYIASHWAYNLPDISGMVAMLDLVYLSKNTKDVVRWERIFDWLQGSVAAAPLYLLLTYLDTYHLIDIAPEILHELSLRQRSFGSLNLQILHALLNRYIVDGHPWGWVCSAYHLGILWKTLLLPGPPLGNLLCVPWNLFLGSRVWTGLSRLRHMPKGVRAVEGQGASPSQGGKT
jgi:hypothetical protein